MNLRVTPQGRIGGNGFVVPLKIAGPMRAPAVTVDAVAPSGGNPGGFAGLIIGGAAALAAQGAFGTNRDVCSGPLAIARGEQPPAEATEAPLPADPLNPNQANPNQANPGKPPNAGALLRQLLR